MKTKRRKIKHEDIPGIIDQLLESDFWLKTVETFTEYERLQDDHDGTYKGKLRVMFSRDGDAFVCTTSRDEDYTESIRFRMPLVGGGMSPRTRVALLILAEAIRQDNEKRPLQILTTNSNLKS